MRQGLLLLFLLYGLSIFLYLFGLNPTGSTSSIFTLLFNPENITTSQIFTLIFSSVTTVGGALTIIYGYLVKNYELAAFAGVALFLLNLIPDWVGIYLSLSQASHILAIIVISPMILAWALVMLDYWRGRD